VGELTCLEICAGAGGQSLGLEQAGFTHAAAVELDPDACETLRLNRGSEWKIIEDDVHNVDGRAFSGIDLLSGGVPCPPFSIAGKQLGQEDDRDLFPQALRLVAEISPRAVLLENVRGLATRRSIPTGPRCLSSSTVSATRPGGTLFTPVITGCRSCGRGSCSWPSPSPGRLTSGGPRRRRYRPPWSVRPCMT
jgi:site-specific DNA-cytosine methylase